MGDLDTRWKNPQGSENQQLYLWAQDLIKELRKGDYLDAALGDSATDGTLFGRAEGAGTGAPASLTAAQGRDIIKPFFTIGRGGFITSTPTTLVTADSGKWFINYNANRTVNLPSATFGLSFGLYTLDGGSGGNLTVTVPGGVMVFEDGSSTNSIVMSSNQRMQLISDGTNWFAYAADFRRPQTGGRTTIASGNLSGANVDITNIPATYAYLQLQVSGASHDNAASRAMTVHLSSNNGSSYDTTAGSYIGFYTNTTPTHTNIGTGSLIGGAAIAAASTQSAALHILGYQGGMFPHGVGALTGGGVNFSSHCAYIGSTSAINAIRMTWFSGANFDAGSYVLSGFH